MKTINVPVEKVACLPVIPIGFVGENDVTEIDFDLTAWAEDLGEGTLTVAIRRPSDTVPYIVTPEISGNVAVWVISDIDVAEEGTVYAQLIYTVGEQIRKNVVFNFTVGYSLETGGDLPDPWESWLDQMIALGATVTEKAAEAAQSASQAMAHAIDAADSATAASGSALSASQSATAAGASATNAAASASSAESSATQAASSATQAGDSATESAASATASAQSAQDASQSASDAGQSATDAEASATAAAQSAADAQAILDDIETALANKADVITDTASGDIVSISDAASAPAESLVVTLEPIQSGSGTPSPDNVRPITGHEEVETIVSPTTSAEDGTTYTTELGQTVYGGTLDVVTGELVVDKGIVDLGTLTWTESTDSVGLFFRAWAPTGINHPTSGGAIADAICECYPLTHSGDVYNGSLAIGWSASQQANVWMYARDMQFASAAEFKAAMSGMHLCYALATPQTYQLTPLEVVRTLLGENNVWSNAGSVEVEYRADTKMWVLRKLAELSA